MKNTKSSKEHMLFDPTLISTGLALALSRDLGVPTPIVPSLLYSGRYDAKTVFAYRQTTEFLKKYSDSNVDKKVLHRNACDNFVTRNVLLGQRLDNIDFPDVGTGLSGCRSTEHAYLLRARLIVHEILQDFTTEELFFNTKHSSGTSLGLRFNNTNLEDKMLFPLSTTLTAMRLFKIYCNWDPQFTHALMANNGIVHSEHRDLSLSFKELDIQVFNIVEQSRLTTVDKDSTKRRVIAIEPTVNMFFQQGLMTMMYRRLKPYLDLESLQPKHGEYAYLGSIMPQSLATIDFSNASDSLGIEVIRFLLPPAWFEAVMAVRTPQTSFKNGNLKANVGLRMIGTMGNATTFPLETLVFYALANAVSQNHSSTISEPIETLPLSSVFGDDCIMQTVYARRFMSLCTNLGFEVNEEKSYFDPKVKFRESCGSDYFQGRNIRPFYLKAPHNEKMSSLAPWLFIVMNRLLKKYKSYFGGDYYITDKEFFRYCLSLFSEYELLFTFVPESYPDDAGFKLPADWINEFMYDYLEFFDPSIISNGDRWPEYTGRKIKRLKYVQPGRSNQGTYTFLYYRFQYSRKSERGNAVNYWRTLKFPPVNDAFAAVKPSNTYISKRIGGYVVSRGISHNFL